jgi:hypothetical protein
LAAPDWGRPSLTKAELLTRFGRQPRERIGHELWRVAAQALDQI